MAIPAVQSICLSGLVVHQNATGLRGQGVRPAATRETDFDRTATHLTCGLHDGLVFADLAVFDLCDPDLIQALHFGELGIFLADRMVLGQ
jgi:hypothetical protein